MSDMAKREQEARERESRRPLMPQTSTHTILFGLEDVEKIGEAYQALESSFEDRRDYMLPQARSACEQRLSVLRAAWGLMLEPTPE